MSNDLTGKIAVITGASSGIGRAVAEKFATCGAEVIALARNEEKLKQMKDGLKEKNLSVHIYSCDVGNGSQVKSVFAKILGRFGKVDILINNAGVGIKAPAEETTAEDYHLMMNTNMKGVFLTTSAVLPHMKKARDGYIINVCSGAGKNGIAGLAVYSASKFALRGFSEAVANEAKPFEVRVSIFYPGSVDTPFHEKSGTAVDPEKLNRMIKPEDIAETLCHMVNTPKRYFVFEVTARSLFMG